MKLDSLITKWVNKQIILDSHIYGRFGITPDAARELQDELLLAYKVELGEAANDFRGFKFWSEDQQPRPTLLEELIDCVHFILSLGNLHRQFEDRGTEKRFYYLYPETRTIWAEIKEEDAAFYKKQITKNFNKAFKQIILYETSDYGYREYLAAFQSLLDLTALLGYSLEDLSAAYDAKNEKNHARQDNSY